MNGFGHIEANAASNNKEEQTGEDGRMKNQGEEEQQRGGNGVMEEEKEGGAPAVKEMTRAERFQHQMTVASIQDELQQVKEENKRLCRKLEEIEEHFTKEELSFRATQEMMDKINGDLEDQVLEAEKRFQFKLKANKEKNVKLEEIRENIEASKREIVELQGHVMTSKSYKDIVLRVLRSKGQEVQNGGTEKEGNDQGSRGSKGGSEEDSELLPSTSKTTPSSSSTSDTANSDLHTVKEAEEHLVLPEPEGFVALLQGMEQQILSLMQNPTTVNQAIEHAIETKRKDMKEEQERFSMQIRDMKDKINIEKNCLMIAKRKVELHRLAQREDKDFWLEAVNKKVEETYTALVSPVPNKFSTLKKLTEIEHRMVKLLSDMDDFPPEELNASLERLREDRRRKEEERKKLEMKEKMMKKCKERAYSTPRTIVGKKLMPRSVLAKPKVKVTEETCEPEEDPAAFLFCEDSD